MDLAFTPVRCASYTPQGQTITSRATPTRNLLHNTKPTKIRITSSHFHKHHQLPELQYNVAKDKVILSRRDALGLGLCTSVFFHQVVEPAAVSAEEASSTNSKCQFKVAPSGIQFCDEVVGYGPEATKGQLIKAHYVGKLENGKVFDSSYNRGKPLTFRIGVGEVIKGWDQGILGADGIPPMLAGGKRSLRLPPELAYGMRGAGCKGGSCIIPPDSVLLFDVEFIGKA